MIYLSMKYLNKVFLKLSFMQLIWCVGKLIWFRQTQKIKCNSNVRNVRVRSSKFVSEPETEVDERIYFDNFQKLGVTHFFTAPRGVLPFVRSHQNLVSASATDLYSDTNLCSKSCPCSFISGSSRPRLLGWYQDKNASFSEIFILILFDQKHINPLLVSLELTLIWWLLNWIKEKRFGCIVYKTDL